MLTHHQKSNNFMNPFKDLLSSSVGASICCFALCSQANLISNGSFESGSFDPHYDSDTMIVFPGDSVITDWKVINSAVAWVGQNSWDYSAQEGERFLDLTSYTGSMPFGGIEQSISTIIGQSYVVSFWIGQSNWENDSVNPSIQLSIDNIAVHTFSVAQPLPENTIMWHQFTWEFIANRTETSLSLIGNSPANVNFIGLDNITVNAIPDNGTSIALLGLSFGSLALLLRKQQVLDCSHPAEP